jgi:hypothetical protein
MRGKLDRAQSTGKSLRQATYRLDRFGMVPGIANLVNNQLQ